MKGGIVWFFEIIAQHDVSCKKRFIYMEGKLILSHCKKQNVLGVSKLQFQMSLIYLSKKYFV
jgi:hypothetical protein